MKRSELISQLRHALNEAQKPGDAPVEFEIGTEDFCFEWFDPEDFEEQEEQS